MCGRFVSTQSRYALSEYFGAVEIVGEELPASYNVAPSRLVYAISGSREGRRLGTMRWGLVPYWANSATSGARPINARSETLTTNRLFAEALVRRRCVIPADGFYEWRRGPDRRQPFLFSSPDGHPLAMAGLWSRWSGVGSEPLITCAVITIAANSVVVPVHNRMPVLLDPAAIDQWLNPALVDVEALQAVLVPAEPDALSRREVDPRVNNVANDFPELVALAD